MIRQSEERFRPPKSEIERLLALKAKMRELTGWRGKVGLDEGLRLTMEWIRRHAKLYDPGQFRIQDGRGGQ